MMKISHASPRFATDISICSAITFTLAELVTKGHLRPLKEASEAEKTLLNVSFRSTERQTPYLSKCDFCQKGGTKKPDW